MLRRESRCDTAASLPQGHAHRAFIRAAAHGARAAVVRLARRGFPFPLSSYPRPSLPPSPPPFDTSRWKRFCLQSTFTSARTSVTFPGREPSVSVESRRREREPRQPDGGHLSSGIFQPPDPVICESEERAGQ